MKSMKKLIKALAQYLNGVSTTIKRGDNMKSKLIILITILFVVIVSIGMTILNNDLIQHEFNQSRIYNESKR